MRSADHASQGTPSAHAARMRRPLLALAPLALAACLDPIEIGPIISCDQPLIPGAQCVDVNHPVDFASDSMLLAEDGAAGLDYLALEGYAFVIKTDAPGVVEVVAEPEGRFTLHGRAAGIAHITAEPAGGGVELAGMYVEVAPITAVEFRYDTAGTAALTELAALPGATERLRVVARDPGQRSLAGASAAITFATTGPLGTASLADAERRGGSIDLFSAPSRPGFETAVRFDAVGSGTVIARVRGADLAALPIQVIAAPTGVRLVLAAPQAPVDWFQLVGLVGTDPRGVPVAGLVGDFTASPAGLVTIDDPHAGEAALRTVAPGLVTVTATLPDRTLTTTFQILPR